MIKEKYIVKTKETSINVVQTQVESIRKKDITKTGLRIYKDNLIGVAGAIGSYKEEELEKRAVEGLALNIPYPYKPSEERCEAMDYSSEIIKDEELLDEVEELLGQLRGSQPELSFSNKINITEREVILRNTKNLELSYRDKSISLGLIFKEKSSANLFDGFVGYGGRKYDKEAFLDFAKNICNAYHNKVELPKGDILPVIFADNDGTTLKKLAQDLHGQKFGTGSSLLSDKMGQMVFNKDFTLYQTQNPEDEVLPFFDAEGTTNEGYRFTLIDQGRVISPYTDKKTSTMFNLPLTGSASSEYDGVPNLGYKGFKIKESEKTARELLNGRMGIYVMIASGGDFTPKGDFATPVQLAMLFDGERFIGRLPELQLSSNLFDMFGPAFIGVSKDKLFSLDNTRSLVMEMKVGKM